MLRAALVLILLVLPWSSVAHAEKRVALVIGNGTYQKVSKLPNPVNDAKAIAGMLRDARFDEVVLYENLGFRELRQAIKDFSSLARDADTAVVYYSGHGIEANGINYLIPIDAVLDSDIDVPYEAYSLENLVQVLEPARRLRLVILDACRDNPFARSMKRTIASRAVGGGLAPVEPTSVNTLIGFAAKAGSIALDGERANSPYTIALLNHIATPGLDLRIAFGRVRDEVLKVTRNKQEPFVYGSLGGSEIALVPTKAQPNSAPVTPPKFAVDYDKEMEIAFWNAVKDSKSPSVLQSYLDRFPTGTFAGLARVLIEQLSKEDALRASLDRQAEEAKRAQEAKEAVDRARVEELAAAREEARKAQAALKAAELERESTQRAAEDARKAAETARASSANVAAEPAKIVNLPQGTEPKFSQESVSDPAKLTRALQAELKRVGCDVGELNGRWGTKVKEALREFSQAAKVTLSVDEPTEDALQAVAARKGRICVLKCGANERERNGRCVGDARAERDRQRPKANSPREAQTASKPLQESSRDECIAKCFREGRAYQQGGCRAQCNIGQR